MPRGVVSRERKAAARRHADRSWTCACGKVCWGNGGHSSHQRACRVFQVHYLDVKREQLARYQEQEQRRLSRGYDRMGDSYAALIRGVEDEIRKLLELLAHWPEGSKRPKDAER